MIKSILNFPVQVLQNIGAAFNKFVQACNRPLKSSVMSLKGLISSLFVASVIFALFFFVGPFGAAEYTGSNKTLLITLASAAGFVGMCISEYALPFLFKRYFDKNKWNVSREISLYAIRFFAVGSLVMVICNQTGLAKFDLPLVLLQFTAIGTGIGLLFSFIKENALRKKYESGSEAINDKLQHYAPKENNKMLFPVLAFVGSNDKISIVPNQLISVTVDKYTSKFSYQSFFGVVDKSLDIQEREVRNELSKHGQFIQLSNNEFTNAHAIYKTKADASGYLVHIAKQENPIRLSGKFEKVLENL
ncbi:MAG: hypothetical protein NXI00_15895 [Cytophagales bacterium]|nr:hypothetical protein [Cytophagales bacterium]